MDAEAFNTALRKFLREVGVTSQQEVEKVVASGHVTGPVLRLKMTLTSPDAPLEHVVEREIELG
jgi:16S rRNA U516 pseudouridylate synthase RsuA-like enzyme